MSKKNKNITLRLSIVKISMIIRMLLKSVFFIFYTVTYKV
jgi:hypothetical protein